MEGMEAVEATSYCAPIRSSGLLSILNTGNISRPRMERQAADSSGPGKTVLTYIWTCLQGLLPGMQRPGRLCSNWWMPGGWNDGKVSDSLLSHEKGVVKYRSLLGHFHRLRSASGSQKAHRPRSVLRSQVYASGNRTGFYNRNNNHNTNRV